MFPNSIPDEHDGKNKEGSCAIVPDGKDIDQINCGYDLAKAMLKHLLPDEVKDRNLDYNNNDVGVLYAFDASEYGVVPSIDGLNELSFLYLPKPCIDGTPCHIHTHFHGCGQSVVT